MSPLLQVLKEGTDERYLGCPNGVPHTCNENCTILTTTSKLLIEKHWCQWCMEFQKMTDVFKEEAPKPEQAVCVHGVGLWQKCKLCQ